MLFKFVRGASLVGLALGALTLAGCSLRLGEELEHKQIVVNPAKEGCLGNMGDVLNRYFDGRIEEAELESFWQCTERAFSTFVQNTKGGQGDTYAPEELSSFLSKYFLKGKTIDADLLHEAMVLKTGLVGGREDRLSRAELDRVLVILKAVHAQSLQLRTIMPISAKGFARRRSSGEEFESALLTFETSMKAMSTVVAGAQGSYSLDHMASFLRALQKFLYLKTTVRENWTETAIKWTDALRPAKSIFIAPPADEIRAADWAKIYELAPRYYGLYLKASFYLEPGNSYTRGPGLRRLETLFADFYSLMTLVLSHRPNGAISAAEVDDLLTSLERHDMLPQTLPLDTARSFARAIFGRIFSGVTVQDSYSITKANFDRLREGFSFATEGLRGLEAFYRDRHGEKFDELTIARAEFERFPVDDLLRITARQDETSRAALESLRASARDILTNFPGNATRVLVPEGPPPGDLSLAHLEKVHLLRSINRVLLHGYAGNLGERMSEAQIGLLADDIIPFLQGLGFGGPNLRKAVPSRLLEASIFLYSSDGDRSVTMTEAIEFETLLFSTLLHGLETHREMARVCKADGKQPIPYDCYRQAFVERTNSVWSNIPGLAKFTEALGMNERYQLFDLMDSFVRKANGHPPFISTDSQAFVLMPYYVELLFSRFDLDRNGVIDNQEAERAYPVMQPFLREKCLEHGLKTDKDHRAVFHFLLAYQEIPTEMKGTWIWRRYITGNKNYQVNRGQVMRIFQKLLTL